MPDHTGVTIDPTRVSVPDPSVVTDDLVTVHDPLSILEWYHSQVLAHVLSQGPTPVELEDRHVEWLAYWTTALTTRLDQVLADLLRDTPVN